MKKLVLSVFMSSVIISSAYGEANNKQPSKIRALFNTACEHKLTIIGAMANLAGLYYFNKACSGTLGSDMEPIIETDKLSIDRSARILSLISTYKNLGTIFASIGTGCHLFEIIRLQKEVNKLKNNISLKQ